MKEVKVRVNKRKVNDTINLVSEITHKDGSFLEGCIITALGIIYVYSQGDSQNFHFTRMQTVKDGMLYEMTAKQRYTKRGLARIASKFIKEVYEGKYDNNFEIADINKRRLRRIKKQEKIQKIQMMIAK